MQLVINTFGTSLRRKGERFVVKSGERRVAFSAKKVQSIVVTTGAHFSSDAVELASQNNIDIIFLSKWGNPFARIWQTKMGSTAAIRRRQLEVADMAEGLDVVRGWTCSKLDNQVAFLRQLKQRREDRHSQFDSPLTTIQECRSKIDALDGTVDEIRGSLMGWEGTAGRSYFDCLSRLMPEEYRFGGRSRRPAVDPFNAMLNYAYGVLYSLVERSLVLAGLDPFVGFLHTDNYNKRSLVFDMIEPFRIIAERTTVLLFTGRRAKRDFFREVPGGIELAPDGRAALIADLNKRLDRTVRYPVQNSSRSTPPGRSLTASPADCATGESETTPEPKRATDRKAKKKFRRVKQRAVIQHEAHALANTLLGRKDLPKIVETKDLWEEENDE